MNSKKSNKALYIPVLLIVAVIIAVLFIFFNKEKDTTENQIIGNWTSEDGDECFDMDSVIRFSKDNKVEGIEGFQTYRIEETDHDEYDYAILSGGYEDVTRFRVKVSPEKISIVYEEDDVYDFDSAISCHMTKE